MSQQGLRRRVQNLAADMDLHVEIRAHESHASDLRALLAAHKQAKRENAAMRKALRASVHQPHSSNCVCLRCEILKKAGVTL